MIKFTLEEFMNTYRHENIIKNLSLEIITKVLSLEVINSFIDAICKQVIDYCKSQSPNFNVDNLNEWQQEQLKRAQMKQTIIVLTYSRELPLPPLAPEVIDTLEKVLY